MNTNVNFKIMNITETWDPYAVLNMYKEGQLELDYIKQCFYWNASCQTVQTVNYDNGDRTIQYIQGHDDIKEHLDIYHAAYMSYNAPKSSTYGLNILIIESIDNSIVDKLIDYIKKNVIVTLQDLKLYFRQLDSNINVSTIIKNINEQCLDITVGSSNLSNISNIEPNTILRCSQRGSNNSFNVAYMYYTNIVPYNIKLPKHLNHYHQYANIY